jgi:hypothetical protein
LQELTTVDGMSIWAGDGVNLTSNANRVAALKLMQHIAMEGAGGEPANKRARLESVILTQAAPKPPKPNIPPPPPPTPKPVPPPLWLSGQLPAAQRSRVTGGQHIGVNSQVKEAARAPEEATSPTEVRDRQPQRAAQGAVPGAATRAAGVVGSPPPPAKIVNQRVQHEKISF